MTRDVITVSPGDSIVVAAEKLFSHGLEGLPGIDEHGTLVGLVTQGNLVAQKTNIHLPTLLVIFKEFDLYRKDKKFAKKEIDRLISLKVSDVMNTEPPLLYEGESVDRAIMHLSRVHGVNPTSIVTEARRLLGVITIRDLFKLYKEISPEIAPDMPAPSLLVDNRVGVFMREFKNNFLFIARWRTRAWIMANVFFLLVGIIVAAILMLRVTFN